MSTPLINRLLDAGIEFSDMSQDRAQKLVKQLVKDGRARRKDSEDLVQRLIDRGRDSTEHLVGAIQSEITRQLGRFAKRLDNVESQVEEIAQKLGIATKPVKKAPAKKAPASKATGAAKKAPAKKAGA